MKRDERSYGNSRERSDMNVLIKEHEMYIDKRE